MRYLTRIGGRWPSVPYLSARADVTASDLPLAPTVADVVADAVYRWAGITGAAGWHLAVDCHYWRPAYDAHGCAGEHRIHERCKGPSLIVGRETGARV